MLAGRVAACVLLLPALIVVGCDRESDNSDTRRSPNILFVVMDDVGIDQMQVFGYGGDTPPSTPNIETLAGAGIRFNNTWAMPACTTSRAVFFDGRFPVRSNVYGALGPNDLANSQVSPYDMTVPKLLALRGYASGLFGKFHLGLQGHNPAGYAMPHALGWNYYSGWLDRTGDPSSIDTTAGGVAGPGTWSCGFVPAASAGGADSGACYRADGDCEETASSGPIPPGRTCRDRGGIFDPGNSCHLSPPDYLDFTTLSGHYVSPLVINHEDGEVEQVPPTDPRARHFRAAAVVDAAMEWINNRPAGQPWMATVSFASAHTPVMQPPANELLPDNVASSNLDCAEPVAQRDLTNLMLESIDTELSRLLVGTGLARRSRGRLIYEPGRTDTMVILLGDNGSLGSAVKLPFNPERAKGTAYQTGVWVPLIVAGPLVMRPDRIVSHMVNIADLFELFGEIAGLDVHQAVPRPIDSVAMLPYLRNPNQASIRTMNFTQIGPNLQANGANNGPCVIGSSCTQIPVSKSVCADNNGVWYGSGSDVEGVPPEGLNRCCNVTAFLTARDLPTYTINPDFSTAVRNDRYKLVQNTTMKYQSQEVPCVETVETEFYEINQAVPIPLLDNADRELPLATLTPEQLTIYDTLLTKLNETLASAPSCPGDGNLDSIVNQEDLDNWAFYSETSGLSSVYDFNLDGLTNAADETIIQENLGLDCRAN